MTKLSKICLKHSNRTALGWSLLWFGCWMPVSCRILWSYKFGFSRFLNQLFIYSPVKSIMLVIWSQTGLKARITMSNSFWNFPGSLNSARACINLFFEKSDIFNFIFLLYILARFSMKPIWQLCMQQKRSKIAWCSRTCPKLGLYPQS